MNINQKEIESILDDNFIFSIKQEDSWGFSISVMLKNNWKASGKLYWYTDTTNEIYLEDLYVHESLRQKGIGTELIKTLEKIGISLGAGISYLWVEENSWLYSWYSKLGYEYFKDHEDSGFVWMKKLLK
jgi:GNAT superfamily N-acetyltransferase